MRAANRFLIPVLVIVSIVVVTGVATAEEFKLNLSGAVYTKWLWGTNRDEGSLYNYTDVPGEFFGDNGQGSEIELLIDARISRAVAMHARIHSRFAQNEWTNTGGWGNPRGGIPDPSQCSGGSCGEFDPRSNQYVKLRGMTVFLTPGYKWLDMATIGANDWGMFDPFVVGRIRYIDRDNVNGLLFQGSAARKAFAWDFARISLPRLWAGPLFSTGAYAAADGNYVAQLNYTGGSLWDLAAIGSYTNDIEVDASDRNWNNGKSLKTRFRDGVYGLRFGLHPSQMFDFNAQYYHSSSDTSDLYLPHDFGGVAFAGVGGFSPVPFGKHDDKSWKADLDINDPFGVGLSFKVEGFDIGKDYVALMAARREADVLLTEGHDGAFVFHGASNSRYQPFPNTNDFPSRYIIGYSGFMGNAQQVPTVNVDIQFQDFNEPFAETCIGWKGFTLVPNYSSGPLELAAEYTTIDYNTNWQAWGHPELAIWNHAYPGMELDGGPGISPLVAYQPFQDKSTDIYLVKAKYTVDVGRGLDLFAKVKWLNETDKRLNDARFLPYNAGACPGGGQPCTDDKNFYSPGNTMADLYSNPSVITVNSVTGYQWKPFDSLADDDRDVKYQMFQVGAGYQLGDVLYGRLTYEHFKSDLKDGNTAWQAYNTQEYASGKHDKNILTVQFLYPLSGIECGIDYQYAWGTFEPDFGTGFVTQYASEETSTKFHVPVGSPGFSGRYGGWNRMDNQDITHQHLKAWLKVRF